MNSKSMLATLSIYLMKHIIKMYRLYKHVWIYKADPHNETILTDEEVYSLFAKGGHIIRNTYNFDTNEKTSFWYVIKDKFGGYEELSSKMRNQVNRCFKSMTVKIISSEYLISHGYEIYVRAFELYKVKSKIPTYEEFEYRIKMSEENEFWGVFDMESGALVAFSMNYVTADSCEYRTMKALPEYQKKYAYYGLIYEMNRFYLETKGLRYVNDGARSLTNHSNIQTFLVDKFKFRKAYCNVNVYYKRWLNFIVICLYPFRRLIPLKSLQILFNMESIARNKI